jgi:hypothetical protein
MTNRDRLEAAVLDEVRRQTKLGQEVEYLLDAFESSDPCDAFDHALSVVRHNVARHNGDRPLLRAAVDLLIAVGYYRPRPAGEEVVTLGRDRAPVRRGVRYDADLTLEEWLDIES